ncbi:porin family protein [Janthinobacterium sp.]|uniref:porin family protein n=1 Tax=Janthinobacterium sp. TaxID=1871054 RepID=UPI00293D81F6|nr:porin family protein [Janthinobacterium sp.]
MKKIIFALISSATVLSGISVAHAEGAYVGAGVTASRYKFDVANTSSSDSNSGTKAAGKIFAGYEFDKNWAVEGGYADFGSQGYNYVKNGANGHIDSKSDGFYVAGKATMPVNEQVGVFGKLGLASNKDNISGSGDAAGIANNGRKTGLYASVGAQYAINKNVSLTAEVEHFGKSADFGHKSTALSLGARYNF